MIEKLLSENKNIVVNGDLATGKTRRVGFPLVKEIIDREESLFVLDNRLEYLNQYYDELKKNDYNIVIINLEDMLQSHGWNPLYYPYTLYRMGMEDETLSCLERLSNILFYKEGEVDPFWTSTAADYFTGATLALFEEAKDESEVNIASVGAILDGVDKKKNGRDYVKYYFETKGKRSLGYRYVCATIFAPNETKGGIVAVTRQKLRYLVCRKSLMNLLSKTTFDIENIKKKKSAIFFIGGDILKLPSLFIEQLYNLLSKKNMRMFNMIIDNFDDLDYICDFKKMFSEAVHNNMRFIVLTRDIGALYKEYGSYVEKLITVVDMSTYESEEVIEEYESKIEYPEMKEEVKVFDFDVVIDAITEEPSPSVDDLMEKIDTKIAEIEKEIQE